jgi:hypothetical protein
VIYPGLIALDVYNGFCAPQHYLLLIIYFYRRTGLPFVVPPLLEAYPSKA